MGVNPMQKMKRNSVLIGLIIGLVIGLVLCVILYLFLTSSAGVAITAKGEAVAVSVLNKSVKSGGAISAADITTKVLSRSDIPSDAVSVTSEVVAKIDLSAGTILTKSMLTTADAVTTKDLREQEYNMITLPTELAQGDYIDIRLQLPDGTDYIVVSKKSVQQATASSVWLKMNEEEILTMSNAIVEYYIMTGSKLYATRYTDPGMQEAAIPTYSPNAQVVELINGNKNITSQIVDGQGRFSAELKAIRNSRINAQLNRYNDTGLENLETSIQEEIQSLKESREAYFGTLNAAN